MKSKFIIIVALITLLVYTVMKMMSYENELRKEKIIKLYVEDETKPLVINFSEEEIREFANKSDFDFRADGDYFKELIVKKVNGKKTYNWESVFLKGVNIGVAVPGKFPSEFSLTFEGYLEWFEKIGKMNSNTIRVYTILPPEFYKAFAFYNLNHFDKHLYLMQGVWAKIPKEENYYNPEYDREFSKEIIDVIDVLHGNTVLNPKPGKASGTYSTDVSKYVIAILLGREWEPSAVYKTNRKNSNTHYIGNFVSLPQGNAMESWLASKMDFAVQYETQTYKYQHPVSFVNWLPTDPMYHNTEIIESKKVREYDNDLESIDFEKFHSSELFEPGIFAAYHAYPYYPDYIYLQENYVKTENHKTEKDNYFGYLKDLKKHCKGMPLVIAEYGLPSSRGNSHSTPFGLNQGGHSEEEQAKLSLLLTEDIYETNCAGAIYFEWADEWFKHNWLVMDFEEPFEDRKIWHNMENPEQNFGIYAYESRTKEIDGRVHDWKNFGVEKMNFDSDPGYFYMISNMPELNFEKHNLYIAIDSYDKEKGDHKVPFLNKEFENGFEFLCKFENKNKAEILVDEPYSVFTDIYNDNIPVYVSVKNNNGKFISQNMLTNRGREDLFNVHTDSLIRNRGILKHGNTTLSENSNADWFYNDSTKNIEIRLDWHLINVSDPAKRMVLDDKPKTRKIEVSKTDGIRIYYFVTDKKDKLITQFPEDSPLYYSWKEWKEPKYKKRLKSIYDTLANYFGSLNYRKLKSKINKKIKDSFEFTNFKEDKKGAISISFDNAGFSQFNIGLPVLNKYQLKATVGIVPEILNENSGIVDIGEGVKIKRMSKGNSRLFYKYKNEIGAQYIKNDFVHLKSGIEWKSIYSVLHLNTEVLPNNIPVNFIFVRKKPKNIVLNSEYSNVPYTVVDNNKINNIELDSLLKVNYDNWTIMNYLHFSKDSITNTKMDSSIFISQSNFDKQIRLARNTNYWIATESKVFKYLKEVKASKIVVNEYQGLIFLKIENKLNYSVYNEPLTIKYKTNVKYIRVGGSENDGIYINRTGSILINVVPGKEVRIEKILKDEK